VVRPPPGQFRGHGQARPGPQRLPPVVSFIAASSKAGVGVPAEPGCQHQVDAGFDPLQRPEPAGGLVGDGLAQGHARQGVRQSASPAAGRVILAEGEFRGSAVDRAEEA
jgi:hypothetical protein